MFPSASAMANAVVPVDRQARPASHGAPPSHTGDHSAERGRADRLRAASEDRAPFGTAAPAGGAPLGGGARQPPDGTSPLVARAASKHVHRRRAASLPTAGSRFTGHSTGSAMRAPRGASFHAS